MLKKLIYILLFVVISVAGYNGALLITAYRLSDFVNQCANKNNDRDIMENPRNYNKRQVAEFVVRETTCVREKQTWIERIILSPPSVKYEQFRLEESNN